MFITKKKKNLSRYKNVPDIFIFSFMLYVRRPLYILWFMLYILYKTYKNKMTLKTKKLSHKNNRTHIEQRDSSPTNG